MMAAFSHVLPLVLAGLFVAMTPVNVGADEDEFIYPCDDVDDVTCDPLPTSRTFERYPSPTSRPKKKNAPSDPDRYGLVPPFLIGASSVILVYIVSHCLYLHCYAKKRIQTLTERSMSSSTQNPATLVVSDFPSTASLTVRYDGAHGKTEIINATPYLLCHNNPVPAEVAVCTQPAANTGSGFLAKFRRGLGNTGSGKVRCAGGDEKAPPEEASPRLSVCSADSAGTNTRPEADPASIGSSTGERGSLCFVPVARAMCDQTHGRPEWTPVQGIMYNASSGSVGGQEGGMKRDSSHTLVFVPLNNQPMNDYYSATSHRPYVNADGTYLPLEGNASNMAVPLIVEDQASDPGSRESSMIEHEALVHDDVTLPRVGEHTV